MKSSCHSGVRRTSTFGELKVGRQRGLVDLDQEEVSLRNGSEQELDGDAQLVDRLLEADG